MDLDWCSEEDVKNTTLFNGNSIISSKTKKTPTLAVEEVSSKKEEIDITKCFEQNINCETAKELINIMYYLSGVSNHLRTFIRSKGIKFGEKNASPIISNEEFDMILKYQDWLISSASSVKKFFGVPFRRDNSFDPNSNKLFKTSSYKFCNFKETCSIHKNKTKTCDKNHFVFDMIINDIQKLKESLILIGYDNLNLILMNKNIKIKFISENNYSIDFTNLNIDDQDNEFIIDKSLIYKSFDVASYVLNKMYDEANCFLSFNLQTVQITI